MHLQRPVFSAFRLLMLASVFGIAGCGTPPWSIRLDSPSVSTGTQVLVIDRRPEKDKKFRFDDFLKLTHRSYLADANTTPDRITFFRNRLQSLELGERLPLEVSVDQFDIVMDLTGSSSSGAAVLPTGNGAMVVPVGGGNGNNSFICTILATLGSNEARGEAIESFKLGMFDSVKSPTTAIAAQACISNAINEWLSNVNLLSQ